MWARLIPRQKEKHGRGVGWAKPTGPAGAHQGLLVGTARKSTPLPTLRRVPSAKIRSNFLSATQSSAKEHFTASSVEEHRRTSTSSPTWPRFCKRGHFSWNRDNSGANNPAKILFLGDHSVGATTAVSFLID